MSNVDPYIVNPPKLFVSDPELSAWYNYTNRFLHDLWQAVTGGTGDPDEVETVEGAYTSYRVNQNYATISELLERIECLERSINVNHINDLKDRIESLERVVDLNKSFSFSASPSSSSTESIEVPPPAISRDFRAVTISSDTTLNDYDFANVKSGATVTLPQYPLENSVIIIRNGDGSAVKINANGKKLNSESINKLYKKNTSLVVQYFIDSDEWLVR